MENFIYLSMETAKNYVVYGAFVVFIIAAVVLILIAKDNYTNKVN